MKDEIALNMVRHKRGRIIKKTRYLDWVLTPEFRITCIMLILDNLKTTKYMNIKFYWSNLNEAFPCCSITNADEKTINCINGLLIDTGGCGIHDTLAWLEVGINIFKKKVLSH